MAGRAIPQRLESNTALKVRITSTRLLDIHGLADTCAANVKSWVQILFDPRVIKAKGARVLH